MHPWCPGGLHIGVYRRHPHRLAKGCSKGTHPRTSTSELCFVVRCCHHWAHCTPVPAKRRGRQDCAAHGHTAEGGGARRRGREGPQPKRGPRAVWSRSGAVRGPHGGVRDPRRPPAVWSTHGIWQASDPLVPPPPPHRPCGGGHGGGPSAAEADGGTWVGGAGPSPGGSCAGAVPPPPPPRPRRSPPVRSGLRRWGLAVGRWRVTRRRCPKSGPPRPPAVLRRPNPKPSPGPAGLP